MRRETDRGYDRTAPVKAEAAEAASTMVIRLIEREDIFLRADFFQDLWPNRNADFAQVRFS